ncbi:MAG: TraM recognition domain-containing protein [Clostridia bacterium]|nr:TraM recognition domain-containing protein [Clostridia bacterium]
MKYIDKFLKFLKTDRNTFATYVLSLITVYIVVDRLIELVFMGLTGVASSYWGAIQYTLALACPVFAFCFSFASKFVKGSKMKLSFFYVYCISLYIIALSMFVQWFNAGCWVLLTFVPNFTGIIADFSDLIHPAFSAIALYLPVATFYPVFKWLFLGVNDTKKWKDSIQDYGGIDLAPPDESIVGPYSCEITLCKDKDTGKNVKVPENRRYESTLIVGGSGTGKTTMVFEPMIARDMEKKHFYKEVAKEMGFAALRSGVASLNSPYDNEYMNKNFSLNMIKPNQNKSKIYKAYFKRLIYNASDDKFVYRDLGITYLAPDYESTNRMLDVANNYNISVNIVDPSNPDSIGTNPFVHKDPIKTAIAISSVLKGMYVSNRVDVEEAFRENVVVQVVENLCILLKEVYPLTHQGTLPNLEDLLALMGDFDLVEKMCKQMESDEVLAQKYSILLSYFKKNFYKNSSGRADTEKFISPATTQLDNLLRYPGVRNILCNRTHNINFDDALANGEVTLVCTRRGDLGATAHQAFGLFVLLLMQYSVLTRPGNEKTRIPHFLYIDEFPDFMCKSTVPIFTLYRKYRVGTVISAQGLSQFGASGKDNYREIILGNSSSKLVFGGNTPDENKWWELEFGKHREWQWNDSYDTAKGEYDPKLAGIKWGWKEYFMADKLSKLKFKECAYKIRNAKGKALIGPGKVDFLESKYKEKQNDKTFNFFKYTSGIYDESKKPHEPGIETSKRDSFLNDSDDDFDPIQHDVADGYFFLNSTDGISIDLKNKKNDDNKKS